MRALIADIDAERRDAVTAELERQGHEVEVVESVREVLREGHQVDLVVLGWHVEGNEAVDVCRDLRAVPDSEPPVVVLVGDRSEADLGEALEAGASDVWTIAPGAQRTDVAVRLALARHYARLQAENLRMGGEFTLMRQALDLAGTGFVLTDPRLDDNPIVYANESFYAITGYGEDEVLGRNCRFLQGPDTDPDEVARLRKALRESRPVEVELRNYTKEGKAFWNELHVAPVRDARGEVVRHVGIQIDVTAYRLQEERVAAERQARRTAEARERRSAFLAAASPRLDAQLDERSTLDSLARLIVPRLADVCLVSVLEAGELRRVAVSAADPGLERALRRTEPELRVDVDHPVERVVGRGRAETIVDRQPEPVAGAAVQALLEARTDGRSPVWMLVPLRARGRSIGLLTLAGLSGRPDQMGPTELALAEELAERASLALDNARLYEQQVDVAQTLQASFLPADLPPREGLELAARYRPADAAVDIGGDFYDVLALDDGATAIAVGDVTGKGADAAALTGLCRHTLRTAWRYEQEPEAVLRTLNLMLVAERADRGRYATVVVGVLRPRTDGQVDLRIVCAGHPSPRVLRADGTVEALGSRGTILGWREEVELRPLDTVLAADDTLICFTDGVSSGDGSGPLDADQLDAELTRAATLPLPDVVARVQSAAVRAQVGRPSDDVVILAARATG